MSGQLLSSKIVVVEEEPKPEEQDGGCGGCDATGATSLLALAGLALLRRRRGLTQAQEA